MNNYKYSCGLKNANETIFNQQQFGSVHAYTYFKRVILYNVNYYVEGFFRFIIVNPGIL